jgi:hypothetical protein
MIMFHSQSSIVTMIICLCMGSLVALPMGDFLGVSNLEMVGIELENANQYEQAEPDDEFVINFSGDPRDDIFALQLRSTNLIIKNSFLVPIFPPPKSA